VPNALVATALVLAVIVSGWFAFKPTVTEKEGELRPTESGGVERVREKRTFVDANGKVVILVLLIPIGLCGAAMAMRTTGSATAAGAALVGFSLIGALFWTGAAFYLPSALLMLLGAGLVELGIVEGEY
jgi:hypothetical protein